MTFGGETRATSEVSHDVSAFASHLHLQEARMITLRLRWQPAAEPPRMQVN
jgi:hypothetical protein